MVRLTVIPRRYPPSDSVSQVAGAVTVGVEGSSVPLIARITWSTITIVSKAMSFYMHGANLHDRLED